MHAIRQNSLTRRLSSRRGYAMLMVLIFLVLFLALLGTAWRGMGSALRVASARSLQSQRDEGSIGALARAMQLLETGAPPASPYVCGVTIATASNGARPYTVTFSQEDTTTWSVHVSPTQPTESPTPMPATFASTH
jgi:hypothetical protein